MSALSETYMSSTEAAAVLGLRPYVIQKLIKRGRLPGEKIANRWLVPRPFVEELVKTYVPKRGRPKTKPTESGRGQA